MDLADTQLLRENLKTAPCVRDDYHKALGHFAALLRFVRTDHAALFWDAAVQTPISGKCAMTVMGDWAEGYPKARGLTPRKKLGWARFP